MIVPQPRAIPAIALLPEGSVLKKVMLPRYDRERKLIGVLNSEEMTLITTDKIFGTVVSMELFNPDRSPRGRVDLTKALFDQKKGLLEANQPVTIVSDRVTAHGSGLVYAFDQGKGFLIGPATTRISQPTATAMHSPSPAFPLRIATLFGASLLPILAAPPAAVTPQEVAEIEKAAASKAATIQEENKNTRTSLRANLEQSEKANRETLAFLDQAELLAQNAPTENLPEAVPLAPGADPEITTISCDGGMYFDPNEGVFVYLKNVKVNDPRFTLTGANELKIFFDKKEPPAKEAPKADPKAPAKPEAKDTQGVKQAGKNDALSFGGGNIGDPRKVVATGTVRLLQKSTDGKPPVEASGGIFTYDLVTGEKVISQRYPWVMQGTTYFRAKQPNLILRLDKDFSVVTEGDWDTGMKLDQQPGKR